MMNATRPCWRFTKFKDYIETRKRVLQDKIQAFPEQKQKGLAYRKAVQKLNDIEERGYEYSSVQDFYDRVKADIRQAGSVDTYHTLQDALDKINGSEALSRQYAPYPGECRRVNETAGPGRCNRLGRFLL